jgi:hypothetical protein
MKNLILISMLAVATGAIASTPKSPDIIVDSKLDFNWSDMLVQKIRRLLVNKGHADPFKNKIESEIVIVDSVASQLVAPGSQALLNDLSNMIGVKLLNARSRIVVKNFYYEVGSITTDLRTTRKTTKGLIIDGDFSAGEIKVVSDEILLILEIPNADGSQIPLIKVKIKKPFFLTEGQTHLTVGASVQILEEKNDIKFKVLQSDFAKMADLLATRPNNIQLGFADLEIPRISVRIGNKEITIEPEKVKDFIAEREDQFKSLLIDQLRIKLQEGAAAPFVKVLEEVVIPREHWLITSSVSSQFKIGKISSDGFEKNLEVSLPADFCTNSRFKSYKRNCVNLKETKAPTSLITMKDHQNSMDDIKDSLTSGSANLVASISEDYLNKLLAATFDAGMYNEMLAEADAALGPRKVFVRLDEKGENATLYADVKYNIKGFQSLVVGKGEIRFPLVLKCSMRIEKKAGDIPVLIIKLVDADLSDHILRNGIPELNLQSTIQNVPRFKGKILKTIQTSLNKFLGKDILSLNYPEFKGLGLETVNFTSDGSGRLGAHVRLEELLRVEEEKN